ncbi:hypothetical protein HPP92_012949 [Vanilla planifolia]|uniref:tRNA/rRNA methyltransferase SpoU type domain-containing protein n=1 Tax=Vanilla planifolia TaxID=51239 RepID=A0A835UUS8_VANPL|nr:hypothetical protein HPP92_013415 [Vanilla planifolia]KAG0478230.1 hypothetical protein HPP92_012949 [Vanilla planifolia]
MNHWRPCIGWLMRLKESRYKENRHVSKGAEKWLDIELWNSSIECFQALRTRGYRIATTNLGMDTVTIMAKVMEVDGGKVRDNIDETFERRVSSMHMVSIYDLDWTHPTAIVVGNEHFGISHEALQLSDLNCSIPMKGMVDSFNVSVAAGILMHHAVSDRVSRLGRHGDLTYEERQILLAEFFLRHRECATSVVQEYAKRKLESLA